MKTWSPENGPYKLGYVATRLGDRGGFFVEPPARSEVPEGALKVPSLNVDWDVERYSRPHPPVFLGTLKNTRRFAASPLISVNYLPIIGPGTDRFHIPMELQQLYEFLRVAASVPRKKYAFLTVDQRHVRKGEIPRGPGIHADGVQGPTVVQKQPVEHAVMCVNIGPTRFWNQGFDLSKVDADKEYLNPHFEVGADPNTAMSFGAFDVHLFSTYSPHDPVPSDQEGIRTFVRVSFSDIWHDRAQNTENSMLPSLCGRQYERPVPAELTDRFGQPIGGRIPDLIPPRSINGVQLAPLTLG